MSTTDRRAWLRSVAAGAAATLLTPRTLLAQNPAPPRTYRYGRGLDRQRAGRPRQTSEPHARQGRDRRCRHRTGEGRRRQRRGRRGDGERRRQPLEHREAMMRSGGVRRLFTALLIAAGAMTAAGQAPPRTPWGDPDLQGVWPSGPLNAVPFERPKEFGLRAQLTDAEFAERAAALQRQAAADATEFAAPAPAVTVPLGPSHWLESGRPSRQTSLIVDPPDGRLPPMTEEGARRAKAWPSTNPAVGYARAQDFNVYDRCITRGVLGSAFPNIYSSGMEIVQAPGIVVIRHEMVHEARIIPLDGRPHVAPAIRSYMGDPRGRWDGATLVVETTNFNGLTGSLGRNGNGNPTSTALRLVERFTRRDADTLDYSVVIDDPQTWTRTWTVAFSLTRDPEYRIFEYACHEGNYAIPNMLRGFRAAEQGR